MEKFVFISTVITLSDHLYKTGNRIFLKRIIFCLNEGAFLDNLLCLL